MEREHQSESTRRRFLKASAIAGIAGVSAGCLSQDEATPAPTETSEQPTTSGGETTDQTTAQNTSTTATGDSYSVSMEPVGTTEFDEPPETWFPYTADYADMGVALGQADGLAAIGVRARFGTHMYEELPGVSVAKDDLTQLWQDGTGQEVFYNLDADLHVIDPNFMINRLGWSQSDVDEIEERVAPFFGNTGFSRAYGWHDYQYYSMYELFEKLAAVFQERGRYEAFKQYHDEILEDVQSRLPSETPDIAVLYPAGVPPESFYPYLVGEGTQSKQWNDLGVGDALEKNGVTDAQAGGSTIDYETLLEIDPDAIAVRLQGEITEEYFDREIRSPMEEHDIGSRLSAVQNDRVFYGGLTYQGPIIHLFQLEAAARGIYPDEFGDDEQLFDRQHVADIVTDDY